MDVFRFKSTATGIPARRSVPLHRLPGCSFQDIKARVQGRRSLLDAPILGTDWPATKAIVIDVWRCIEAGELDC